MNDYEKLLEQQNEQLREKLAVLERYVAWRDARASHKLYFFYTRSHTWKNIDGRRYSAREQITRSHVKRDMEAIKREGIEPYLKRVYSNIFKDGTYMDSFYITIHAVHHRGWDHLRLGYEHSVYNIFRWELTYAAV